MSRCFPLVACFLVLSMPRISLAQGNGTEGDSASLVSRAVIRLVELQEEDGAWPYEGVYRVGGEIPVGYRIVGTAIVCDALLTAAQGEDETTCQDAVQRGIALILQELDHPLMKPSTENRYDVRVWGHIYALNLFCKIQSDEQALVSEQQRQRIETWIEKLTSALIEQEIEGGGWNYANQVRHAAFVTAPAVQALLAARSAGQQVPDDLFQRAAKVLQNSRSADGAYAYSGTNPGDRMSKLPGSIARSAICETTLLLLEQGSVEDLQKAIDGFHTHWNELEKRRKKTGTHKPPYGVAPYYFYYGHRYLAQAISMLPEEQRDAEYRRFDAVLMKTKDNDDTWNDRVFDRSKAFGTAMAVLALQADRQ